MRKGWIIFVCVFVACSTSKKTQQNIAPGEQAERILKTLSADDMRGRGASTEGIEKAAQFIESEFNNIGLQFARGATGYRQAFTSTRIRPSAVSVTIDGHAISPDSVAVLSDLPLVEWNSNAELVYIRAGENIFQRYREISAQNKQSLVLIDPSFATDFGQLRAYLAGGRIVENKNDQLAAVFVLGAQQAANYQVKIENKVETLNLNNLVATIPGKSRPGEIVIFSAHYDHIGIQPAVNGDSIANGADDDASGTTAVIELARYFKQMNNNERTIMFVAFTAEELGLVGSKYFSKQMNADSVIAMFNIEMIGKESKFGKNAAFITGFDRSNFGSILQKNLEGTEFKFHPDPYTEQNLFYRSDNASLAERGVPAHTISTDQIDKDKYYHTVDDEYQTLDIENVKSTIRAIALSARGIVAGTETPSRVSLR
jgi:hypothetical protein